MGEAGGEESREISITAPDGLILKLRQHGPRQTDAVPVLCLPGLARTAVDFDQLADTLTADSEPRRVFALDYRGRGRSQYDRDPRNYTLPVELADVLAVITALELSPAIIIGTSRGGLLAMLLAAVRPTAVAGVVLNDIGPVIEPQGLMRIKGYVGKLPMPRTFDEGAEILQRNSGNHFPKLAAQDWLDQARRSHGPALSRTEEAKVYVSVWNDAGAVPIDRIRTSFIQTARKATLNATCPKSWRSWPLRTRRA